MEAISATERLQRLMHDVCPLKIGDLVKVSPKCRYAADWPGTYIVTGMRWEYQRRAGAINLAIAAEDEIVRGDGETDGFSVDDLIFVRR